MKKAAGRVRRANSADIPLIEKWLPSDPRIESLAVNWKLTKKVFEKKGMWIWEDGNTLDPVAYFWGRLSSTDSILEVAPHRRGEGIGRAFVRYLIRRQRRIIQPLLEVHCAPESSAEFWMAMGFELFHDHYERKLLARRVLELRKRQSADGQRVGIKVSYLLYRKDGNQDIPPIHTYSFEGLQRHSGYIEFPQVVACFSPEDGEDIAITIAVDDELTFVGKANSKAAQSLGVSACDNGFLLSGLSMRTG